MTIEKNPKVAIVRSRYKDVDQNIEKVFSLLAYTPKEDAIFIKPNLVDSYTPETGIIKSPMIIEAHGKNVRYGK